MTCYRKKKDIWGEIEKVFNSSSSSEFWNADGLKTKYQNMKKRAKTKFSNAKVHSRGTDGGPPLDVNLTSVDHQVASILGTRLTGRQSVYDDDSKNILCIV